MSTLFPSDNTLFPSSENSFARFETSCSLWDTIKLKLQSLLDIGSYQTWIDPLNSAQLTSNNELIISLPNMTFHQVIFDKLMKYFDICKIEMGLSITFRFELEESDVKNIETFPSFPVAPSNDYTSQLANNLPSHLPESEAEPVGVTVSRALTHQSDLNKAYTFANFVNGSSNQFAHASCLSVADDPGQNYNPLFIYGSTGLGKTHLLHAVGNHVLRARPDFVVTYITSEHFMNEMIYCLRFNKMMDFRRKYRNCDVLLVDDIQFISKRERTQEEFFHTFNSLYEAKKQIVVTSDIFPQDIPDIEDRLRNRFQWGLIADIQPPDVEHRTAILLNKADLLNIPLSQDVADYIAHHVKGSVRLLEGALKRVAAFAALQGSICTLKLASQALQNVIPEPTKNISIDHIQKIVADHFKLRVSDLKSKKRQRSFSHPRQIAMYLSRTRTDSSFPDIGERFGGKDHTTVMHAYKKIEHDMGKDIELKNHIESLKRKLDQ